MNRPPRCLLAGLLIVCLATPALHAEGDYDRNNTMQNQFVLRAPVAERAQLLAQFGLALAGSHGGDDEVVLVEGPEAMTPDQILALMQDDPRIETLEAVELAALPPMSLGGVDPGQEMWADLVLDSVGGTSCLARSQVVEAWRGYSEQAALAQIRLAEAHAISNHCGAVTVAVIDTGVDADHPVLAGSLLPGYDFILDQPGTASEWSALDQSVEAILETSMQAIAEQSVEAILEGDGEVVMLEASMGPVLDPSLIAGLDGVELPPYFGHGTLVSGMILLVAPQATILPLRVFDGEGQGHLFDIVRAIYYAVDQGADVINMSFSMDSFSPELARAIRYARDRGVVCVAAAGNSGSRSLVFPAALPKAVGVASITDDNQISDFSNFGNVLVDVGAPGDGVISTYPGGLFAAGWGTSFSAPLVSGTLALISDEIPGSGPVASFLRIRALNLGSEWLPYLGAKIGHGRLDVQAALLMAQ